MNKPNTSTMNEFIYIIATILAVGYVLIALARKSRIDELKIRKR